MATQLRNASKDKAIAMLSPEQKTKYDSLLENKTPPTAARPTVSFPVLPMSAVERLGPGQRPQGNRDRWALWMTQTTPHRVASKGYVILSDHTSPQWLTPLNKLVRHHHATLLRTSDLSLPASNPRAAASLIAKLKKLQPRFVAIAPRLENYRENTLLAMIKVLSALDDDPQIDTFPGYLIARTPQAFEQLIERAIAYHPVASKAVQPFTVNQISDEKTNMYRSFQKSQMIRLLFETKGYDIPILTVTSRATIARRPDYPGQDGELNWHIVTEDSKQLYDQFPSEAQQHLNDTNLLLMFGHGAPGRVCGMSTGAFASIDMTNQIVLCGSCYSASGLYSDRKHSRLTPDKVIYNPKQERFGLRAISQGATLMFGHMNLNNGFPSVYPMLESLCSGHCAGQAYQQG